MIPLWYLRDLQDHAFATRAPHAENGCWKDQRKCHELAIKLQPRASSPVVSTHIDAWPVQVPSRPQLVEQSRREVSEKEGKKMPFQDHPKVCSVQLFQHRHMDMFSPLSMLCCYECCPCWKSSSMGTCNCVAINKRPWYRIFVVGKTVPWNFKVSKSLMATGNNRRRGPQQENPGRSKYQSK